MNTKSVSISVLQRFMSAGELADFMQKYSDNKKKAHSLKYVPTQADIDLFNRNPRPSIDEFMAHWGV